MLKRRGGDYNMDYDKRLENVAWDYLSPLARAQLISLGLIKEEEKEDDLSKDSQ
uniref:Uncharacterized protein n=2 Tax=viral metagenome TaxID=1070528 RepID=A0A6M3JHI7_9ZZZZ